jgi:hypothetical protein
MACGGLAADVKARGATPGLRDQKRALTGGRVGTDAFGAPLEKVGISAVSLPVREPVLCRLPATLEAGAWQSDETGARHHQ